MSLSIERDGRDMDINITPAEAGEMGGGYTGIIQPMIPKIGDIVSGLPADKAGLEKGDIILSVNGQKITHWIEMSSYIKKSEGKEILLSVRKESGDVELRLVPKLNEESKSYVIGVQYTEEMIFKQFSIAEAIDEGFQKGLELTSLTFDVLKKLFSFDLSIKSLGGPIMIAQATGAAAHSGISDVIMLMAFISLQLGILNLLPIPVLDGGHVFFLLAEMGLRRPISLKTREIAQQIGFAILITLMLIVSYNDVLRVWPF